ncbi:MAG TPA: N-acetylmuramoyl-L-alanine amidase [Vicinamibacterales bacterium]|nr:N-acetylmuramoyl-L-alanine amidase [Vicinamibacterales bacterium]
MALLLGTIAFPAAAVSAAGTSAETLYTRALARERVVRDAANSPSRAAIRRVVAAYEAIVRRYPTSGYSDNALWQAANLSLLAYDQFGNQADREAAARLLDSLKREYPTSSLIRRIDAVLAQADEARASASPPTAVATSSTTAPPAPTASTDAADLPADSPSVPLLRAIHRTVMPDGVRVTLDLDSEVAYHQESLEHPRRLFFDLRGVRTVPALQDVTLNYDDSAVKEIRLGRHPKDTVRVVLDTEGTDGYTVYSLYNPYRLVVDFHRPTAAPSGAAAAPAHTASIEPATRRDASVTVPEAGPVEASSEKSAAGSRPNAPLPSKPSAPSVLPAPAVPNGNGSFSLSRQLGLGVSRIVIDPGHGGHDPGAQGHGLNEADLTLDVALRLRKLLEKQPNFDVVMTRDTDVFIPLEERAAIANRDGADLFLSIHANASRNPKAHGIETYFLNFATNPDAEAVAARENSGSGQSMHSLPDIVKAIALNNKIDESRDFADIVQKSMVRRLSTRRRTVRNLGVKQAPFVVLIGAAMPSVLAEISFVTDRQEAQLLDTAAYRQQIAQALCDAVVAYQHTLKSRRVVAAKGAAF